MIKFLKKRKKSKKHKLPLKNKLDCHALKKRFVVVVSESTWKIFALF
jgi:ribosomal protein L18